MNNQSEAAAFLDVTDPSFDFEGPDISQARERHWYANTPLGPLVLRFAEAADLLSDKRLRFGGPAFMDLKGVKVGPLHDWWMATMMSVDDEVHRRLRTVLNRAFTPAMVENLRPYTAEACADLVGNIKQAPECDFVSAFAEQLPTRVICKMLGVPMDDFAQFHAWSLAIGELFGGPAAFSTPELERLNWGVGQMKTYIAAQLRERYEQPRDDLLSVLVAAQLAEHLSEAEVLDQAVLLIWAGQDTTSKQLGRMAVTFAHHPDQWNALWHDPSLVGNAMEEVLRWSPQAQLNVRFAAQNLTFHDLDVPAHAPVWCSITAASRDGREYDRAEQFDVRLPRKRQSLLFGGGGIHYCLGAAMARMELTEALLALTAAFEPPVLTGPVSYRPSLALIYGPEKLPLSLTPRGG